MLWLHSAALLLALAQSALVFDAGPDDEVTVEADQLVYGWDTELVKLEGHVVVHRGAGVLRAQSGSLDRKTGLMQVSGGVLGVQGRQVFLADSALLDLRAHGAELNNAVLYLKERNANPDAPKAGANALILHGQRVRQDGKAMVAQDVRLTPCDCPGDPDYELLASEARLEGDRAELHGTKLNLLGATVPLFPLSLPLTNRQSGLLQPSIGFGAGVGFAFQQPVFVVLGRSADLTVSPGLFTGTAHTGSPALGARTVRGPRLGLDFRYALAEGSGGSLGADLLYDFDQHDSPDVGAPFAGERGTSSGRGFGGVRGVLHYQHRTDLPEGTLALQGTLASDAMALADAEPTSIERTLDSLRTDLGLWRSRGAFSFGADATFLQDVRVPDGAHPDRRMFGEERRSTFQRLPAAFAQLAPVLLLGPVAVSVEASAARFQALAGPDAEERATGFGPTDRGAAGAPTLALANAARAPVTRLDLSPRLSISGPASLPLDLRAEAGFRADGWWFDGAEAEGRNRLRAYGLATGRASLPLERRFGDTLHRIEPSVEVRALSQPLQSGGAPIGDADDAGGAVYLPMPDAAMQGLSGGVPALRRAYDEVDGAAPWSGAVEAVFGLSQSLWTRGGRTARLDLAQDALLWARGASSRLGEASALLSLQSGPLSAGGTLRYDWEGRDVSVVAGSASLHDARNDEVHGGASLLRGASSERLRAGIDELFAAARLSAAPGELDGTANAGLSGPLPLGKQALRLGYDLSRTLGTLRSDLPEWTHRMSVTLETPCHCAGLLLSAELPWKDGHLFRSPAFRFVLDLKSLGSFTTF